MMFFLDFLDSLRVSFYLWIGATNVAKQHIWLVVVLQMTALITIYIKSLVCHVVLIFGKDKHFFLKGKPFVQYLEDIH